MNFHHLSLTFKSAEFYFKINIPTPTAIPGLTSEPWILLKPMKIGGRGKMKKKKKFLEKNDLSKIKNEIKEKMK